jgi:hypothetical protein
MSTQRLAELAERHAQIDRVVSELKPVLDTVAKDVPRLVRTEALRKMLNAELEGTDARVVMVKTPQDGNGGRAEISRVNSFRR